ncbi:MAG: leucine-rich repeat protein [Muribaculaceae bacterium]|nr:leucine-rich repeat protein [Muribaculaceae bacterium]
MMVIGGTQSEVNTLKTTLTAQGWTLVDQNLNSSCKSGSDIIYLLYKSDYVNSGYVTGFYLSNKSGTASDNITYDGRNFALVPYEGGSRFTQLKGDLNSNAGGDYIHLYITRDAYPSGHAVTGISFNNVQDGAVGKNGGTTGYDLNAGCGSSSDYIYMHFGTDRVGWTYVDVAQRQCRITGFNGKQDEFTVLTVPTTINGSKVLSFNYTMDFSGFTNLETLNFYGNTLIEEMPSLAGLKKFKHVNRLLNNDIIYYDELPSSMITLHTRAFAGTAIKTLLMSSVTNVPDGLVGVFEGCDSLQRVKFEKEAYIGENAFANIHSDSCVVIYPGSIDKWDYKRFHHSPNLIVKEIENSWFMGWCGDTIATNGLYWKMETPQNTGNSLYISCIDEEHYNNYREAQVIKTHTWEWARKLNYTYGKVYFDHVFCIGEKEFKDYNTITEVYMNATLDSIGPSAFAGCNRLTHLWFDGTETEWNNVRKDSLWRVDTYPAVHWRCTVTFDANGHGTAPEPQSGLWRLKDAIAKPAAPTAYRYDFTGWYREVACINRWNFDNVIPGDMTLYAGWKKSIYALGDIDGNGAVDGNDLNILINILLDKDSNDYAGREDIDGEGGINGSDINMLINIILGKF